MDVTQDRAFDLDLRSFLSAPQAVPPLPPDEWLGGVGEPGGLQHEEVVALGTRTSTSNAPIASGRVRGGTVLDANGVPLDMNDNVAAEDVRTLDEWHVRNTGRALPTVGASAQVP